MSHGFVRLHNLSKAADAAVSRIADDIAALARPA